MIRRIVTLLLICSGPFLLSACGNSSGQGHAHQGDGHNHDHGGGFAEPREITEGNPHFDFTVNKDSHGDYQVQLELDGFVISDAGQRPSLPDDQYAGHAHLFVDRKMDRMVYEKQFPLPRLEPGKHTITIMLSDPAHRPYVLDGQLIRKTVVFEIPHDKEQ